VAFALGPAEEELLERLQELRAVERLHRLRRAELLGHDGVVFERTVRSFEAVVELVPLPEVVVLTRRLGLAVLRVDLAPDSPDGSRPALDPDHDPLGPSAVVASVHDPFGEAPGACGSLHNPDYTRAAVGFVDAIRGAFSFLSARSQAEERIAQYIIREHHRGRPLAEILNDHYVTNRITPDQVKRLLDRPEVIHELGDDLIFDARRGL
jgi:hypothetical protein